MRDVKRPLSGKPRRAGYSTLPIAARETLSQGRRGGQSWSCGAGAGTQFRRGVQPVPHTWQHLILKLNRRWGTETRNPAPRLWAVPTPPSPQGGLQKPATPAPTAGDRGAPYASALPSPNRQPALEHPHPRPPGTEPPRPPAPPASSGPLRAADGERRGAERRLRGARLLPAPVSGSRPRSLPPRHAAQRSSATSSGPSRLPPPRRARRSRAPRGVGARARAVQASRRRAGFGPGPRTRRGGETGGERAPELAASCLRPRSPSAERRLRLEVRKVWWASGVNPARMGRHCGISTAAEAGSRRNPAWP